jgi:serine/threonine protein kinase
LALAAGLCPACLLTTALADADGACPYRVLAPIAESSASVTYLAQALRGSRRYVALKVFDGHEHVSGALARFERWKPMLDGIQHPSVARLLDAGTTPEGLLYLASEFIPGWPLTAARTAALERRVRQTLAWQLADAVAAIHAVGAAHLALAPCRVKVSTASGPRATIVGVGVALVAGDRDCDANEDLPALLALIRQLGIAVPSGVHATADALRDALSSGL